MQVSEFDVIGPRHSDENNRIEPPESLPSSNPDSEVHNRADWVRWIAVLHLLAIANCLVFTLADRGLFVSNRLSGFVIQGGGILQILSLLGLFLFPVAMLVLLLSGRLKGKSAAYGVLVEVVLTITHVMVLQPQVQ
jgi:hypothetical protein